jgi:alkanesulfonate monooxygenase SsuD/methylene tetrahydromethanopterin reductase-like flavin-dependent oxidoreductase (luciferase family)
MISKFSTVYAGHVDLGDMGQAATPANERRYSNAHLASVFDKTEAIARCMDEHGYHILWLAEHHFQHEGYECIPNILMEAVHLAYVTRHLRIGCGFNITPMWHPLRLAEDFATADILTGGRTVFASAAATTRERSRRSAARCSTPRRTGSSSRSRWTSS